MCATASMESSFNVFSSQLIQITVDTRDKALENYNLFYFQTKDKNSLKLSIFKCMLL